MTAAYYDGVAIADQPLDEPDGLHDRVGRNVRILMASKGIVHQKDLADLSGVEASKLNRMLNRRQPWTLEVVQDLAGFFDVEPWLLLAHADELLRSRCFAVATGALPAQLEMPFGSQRPALELVGNRPD